MKFLGIILFGVVLVGLLAFGLSRIIRTKPPPPAQISCEKNPGPFNTDLVSPDVTKSDLKGKLIEYYNKCLKPEYEKGYISSPNNNSESQSYALMQSYWSSDKKTFENVLNWTNKNIKRPQDNLFSWKFDIIDGKAKVKDTNSATDADTDIAYALFKAGMQWNKSDYVEQAKAIINDLWNIETVSINGKRYVIGGPWANSETSIVINPSYISPHAYQTFDLFDDDHDWKKLAVDSYIFLDRLNLPPPNWVVVSKSNEVLSRYSDKADSMNFSYDAFRTFWRVAMDQSNNPNQLSWDYISSIKLYESDWKTRQQVCSLYIYRDQKYDCDNSTTGTLAAPISVFSVSNGYLANQMIEKYYIHDGKLEFPDVDFFPKSWHWFGSWLWANS